MAGKAAISLQPEIGNYDWQPGVFPVNPIVTLTLTIGNIMNANRIVFPLLALLMGVFSAIALEAKEKYQVKPVEIPDGLSRDGAMASIVNAAIGRRWNIVKKTDDQIILNLKHRGYDSTLTLQIKSSRINISSDSWTVDKKGEKKKKKDPAGWIENLRKDIVVFMNRELYQ